MTMSPKQNIYFTVATFHYSISIYAKDITTIIVLFKTITNKPMFPQVFLIQSYWKTNDLTEIWLHV